MANNITGNPWSIDTAGFTYKAPVFIRSLKWYSPATGATLLIQDNQGRTIVSMTANSADPTIDLGNFQWVQGFNVVTLSSGILAVVIHK